MDDYFDMPTSCQHCGETFDLNDGIASEKWYPNTVICENCGNEERRVIEEEEKWEDANLELCNALYEFKETGDKSKISSENLETILNLINGGNE